MDGFVAALRKYAVFTGRAQRSEYWFFILIYALISIVLAVLDSIVGATTAQGGGVLTTLFMLAMLPPTLSVTVRRLHDTGRAGWWMLAGLIPCVGAIVLLVFTVTDSQPSDNRYGPNPKASAPA